MPENELKRGGFFAKKGPKKRSKPRMSLALGTELRERLQAVVEDMAANGIETERGDPANEHWLVCQLVKDYVERYENGYRPEVDTVTEERQKVKW
jgi:hypothetical protein